MRRKAEPVYGSGDGRDSRDEGDGTYWYSVSRTGDGWAFGGLYGVSDTSWQVRGDYEDE